MVINVFIADDHAVLLDGLRFLLEEERDIKVVGTASDGRQAVKQVEKLNPDVVIMDITMPELNGIEATRNIRKICPSTQVVILSMHADIENIREALQAGAKGYILKESAGKEVVNAVLTVYSGKTYFSDSISHKVFDDYSHKSNDGRSPSIIDKLSRREREVLQLVAEGKTSLEIGEILFLSPKTVETYRSRLMQKLDISGVQGLIKFAIKHGITTLDT